MAELDSPQQPPPAQRSPHPAPQVHAPVFASYQQSQRSSGNGWKLAFLCFLLAGGGIYAAWTYLPPFHQFAQVQIDRGMVLAGRIAQRVTQRQPAHTPPAVPVKAQQATPAAPPAAQPVAAAPAPPSENAAPATSNPISQVSTPAPSPETAPGANPVTVATPAAAEALKAAGTAIDKIPAEDGELPGEKDSIILSSKGAEKRLIHHVEPLYPAEARAHATEGTVVLKAVVNASGSVEATRSVEGDPVLANAAVKAVKQWRYRPYIRDGKALPFHTIIIVEFPDMERARAWYRSPEYSLALDVRDEALSRNLILVEGHTSC